MNEEYAMFLSQDAIRVIEIAVTLSGLFAVYVGIGVMRLWPKELPGHIASWGTPIVCLLCCGAIFTLSWLEQPRTFGSWLGVGLSIAVAFMILLLVYLYRWEKKHGY